MALVARKLVRKVALAVMVFARTGFAKTGFAKTGFAVKPRLAVASLAAVAGLATFTLDFDFDLEAGLLLIKDFFVTAIVISPRGLELNFFTPSWIASGVPNHTRKLEKT